MVTLTTGQLIFAIIMIWTAGFAIGAVIIARVAHKLQEKENNSLRDIIRTLNNK